MYLHVIRHTLQKSSLPPCVCSSFSLMNGETHQTAQNLKWVNTASFSRELTALLGTDTHSRATETNRAETPGRSKPEFIKLL